MFDETYAPEKAEVRESACAAQAEDDGAVRRCESAVTLNEIQLLAYAKWAAAGKPVGDSLRFWLEAEQQLLQQRSKPCRD